ncbi:MAG: endonuclease/exonuclease/phosphatase family protein [Cellulosilyticaceae bacterium]
MRIATYNIAAGQYCNQQLQVLKEQIEKYEVDIVGVQEVDYLTGRSGKVDQIQALKGRESDFTKFDQAIAFDGGSYGLGMVCQLPVSASNFEKLESKKYEQRIIQKFSIQIGDRIGSFYNTHLSFEDSKVRAEQMHYLKDLLDHDTSAFQIVTGDFNIESIAEWALFQEDYQLVNGYGGIWHDTFPGDDCITHQLDQIILSKHFSIAQVDVVKTNYSDHYMLWTEVSLNQ